MYIRLLPVSPFIFLRFNLLFILRFVQTGEILRLQFGIGYLRKVMSSLLIYKMSRSAPVILILIFTGISSSSKLFPFNTFG